MVDFTIQNGANLSRAKVVKFKHNNVEDLERVLQSELQLHAKLKCAFDDASLHKGNLVHANCKPGVSQFPRCRAFSTMTVAVKYVPSLFLKHQEFRIVPAS